MNNFGAIPGQSLTREPGSTEYERPPEFNTEEEVLDYYMDWLNEDGNLDGVFTLMQKPVPVSNIMNMMVRSRVMKGIHSVDMGVVIKPAVHEYITTIAESEGIDYVDTPQDQLEERKNTMDERSKVVTLASGRDFSGPQKSEEMPAPQAPKGLMAKRGEV